MSIEDEGFEYEDLTFLIKRKSFNHTKDHACFGSNKPGDFNNKYSDL